MCQCQCHHPPPAGRWHKEVQCQLSVSCVLSTSINLYQLVSSWSWLSSQSHQKSPFECLFKKNGFLAVAYSDLGLELTSSSLRQNISWACFSATCSLHCINPQALIRTTSWNQQKSQRTSFWNLQKNSPKLIDSSVRSKKKLSFKHFKALQLLLQFLVWNEQATLSSLIV